MQNLTTIFRIALSWRLTVEHSCSSEHSFFFPIHGHEYERKPLTRAERDVEDKIVPRRGKVLLGFMPEVRRKVRKTMTGGFRETSVIWNSRLLAMDTNQAEAGGSA